MNLSLVRAHLEDQSFAVLTDFKDGLALRALRYYANGTGVNFYYFLHRNGEEMIYSIGSIGVSFSGYSTSEKPKVISPSFPY